MGQEDEIEERNAIFADYRVDEKMMARAKPDAFFMHCLPAHRGSEVTQEVMDGPQCIAYDIAENRLHVQKALLALLIR
jgi:ornithine carbamoyltransferase